MSHPRCKVLDSRITSRSDPASFGPLAGIIFLETRTSAGTGGARLNQRHGGGGGGPEGEEDMPGFRGLVMVFAGIGRFEEAGP